jgi:hypothetical protein
MRSRAQRSALFPASLASQPRQPATLAASAWAEDFRQKTSPPVWLQGRQAVKRLTRLLPRLGSPVDALPQGGPALPAWLRRLRLWAGGRSSISQQQAQQLSTEQPRIGDLACAVGQRPDLDAIMNRVPRSRGPTVAAHPPTVRRGASRRSETLRSLDTQPVLTSASSIL